jgi:HK97 gp10 family phage protein
MSSMSLIGGNELIRKLNSLERKARNQIVRKAMRSGAKITQTKIKELVPVRTGALKRTIRVRVPKGKKRRNTYRIGVETGTREQLGIDPADPYYYPAAVEFGHPKAPPHSYMRKGLRMARDKVIRFVSGNIAILLRAAART